MEQPQLSIDIDRLMARIEALAALGSLDATEGTSGPDQKLGCCRLALTDEDKAGRDLVVTWMKDLGLNVATDGIGNVVATMPHSAGTWEPGTAPVMTGSHIDTVRTGGRYDGNLGVLAGLEVIETVQSAGIQLDRPLAVAFFTNEEGARFAPDMMGSLVYAGGMPLETALTIQGIDGAIVGEELERIGYAGAGPLPGQAPHAFIELHIEQGPVLESEGLQIGAVTGVQGISWNELTITGQSNHAGTTPMSMRHDAGYAAARVATFVRELALEFGDPQVGTVGAINLHPNLINVVAATATMTVDIRNTDEATLKLAEAHLGIFLEQLAHSEGVTIEVRSLARFEPVAFDPDVIDLVASAAQSQGLSVRRMPSGAGHDAQMLARLCPTAMIFTPSVGGISHNPAEHTDVDDLSAGANVLLSVLVQLASSTP